MGARNKDIIRALNGGFEAGDAEAILACLSDDVVWHVPPHFTARGERGLPGADQQPGGGWTAGDRVAQSRG